MHIQTVQYSTLIQHEHACTHCKWRNRDSQTHLHTHTHTYSPVVPSATVSVYVCTYVHTRSRPHTSSMMAPKLSSTMLGEGLEGSLSVISGEECTSLQHTEEGGGERGHNEPNTAATDRPLPCLHARMYSIQHIIHTHTQHIHTCTYVHMYVRMHQHGGTSVTVHLLIYVTLYMRHTWQHHYCTAVSPTSSTRTPVTLHTVLR